MSWRLAINRQRASARALRRDTAWFESAMPPSLGAETLASRREFHARLREEIDRLPEKLRAALLLSAVDGLDARTVSAILEIPEGTVRSRLHLARKQLLRDRKSTRLNSSHGYISYAVFCLKKKK